MEEEGIVSTVSIDEATLAPFSINAEFQHDNAPIEDIVKKNDNFIVYYKRPTLYENEDAPENGVDHIMCYARKGSKAR